MKIAQVTVTIGEIDRFDHILKAAQQLGFEVKASFPKLGTVTGSISRDKLPALRHLAGITSIEDQRQYIVL